MPDDGAQQLGVEVHAKLVGDGEQQGVRGLDGGIGGEFPGNGVGRANEEHSVGLTDTSGVYLTAREVAQIHRAATGRTGGFVGSVRTPSACSTDTTAAWYGEGA